MRPRVTLDGARHEGYHLQAAQYHQTVETYNRGRARLLCDGEGSSMVATWRRRDHTVGLSEKLDGFKGGLLHTNEE